MISQTFASGIIITADESKIQTIRHPGYIRAMDRVFCSNGDQYLATKALPDCIELMLVSRRKIPVHELDAFLHGVSHIERADCFEKG